jgi:hypothetical protein
MGTPVPKITDEYNSVSGALEKESSTAGAVTKTISSHDNTLGQLSSYSDADGNTATYSYEERDGKVKSISDGSEEGEGKQNYAYDHTTGELTSLTDSAAGTFGATYDVEGKLTSESYPNGMTAFYTTNGAGAPIALQYKKMTHCSANCTWLSDSLVPSIHGETLEQTSTLAHEILYAHDGAGRLARVEETPSGEGCKTRSYVYDEDNNRTREISREPGPEGKCATEGGSSEWHTYDTADRLTDPGVTYDSFGNAVALPAADAGGSEMTSHFYVDNQIAKQSQNGKTIEYMLDPEDRTREIISTGTTASTVVTHYDGPGSAVAWTKATTGEVVRDIPGIGGELTAIKAGATSAVLELHDLEGDIIAKAALSETEPGLLETFRSTEFGVPTTTAAPQKYAWLGADGLGSELTSGAITQDGDVYVPQTGRQLQTQAVDVPVPSNSVARYTASLPPEAAELLAETAGRLVAQEEAARAAREQAALPPGVTPTPGCNEEVEGCGADPEHGNNVAGCRVWPSWEHFFNNRLGVNGHFRCNAPVYGVNFEVQVALLLVGPNGQYTMVKHGTRVYHNIAYGHSYAWSPGGWACVSGSWYQAWAWGRFWFGTGATLWDASAEDGHFERCPYAEDDPTGGPVTPTPDS